MNARNKFMNVRNIGVLLTIVPLTALFTGACRTTSHEPSIFAVEPSKVHVTALPVTVNILGEGLFHQVRLTVDQRSALQVLAASVKLGGTELEEPHLQSSNQLTATVPDELAIGVYDLEVTLGNGKSAIMPRAFEVVGDGALLVSPNANTDHTDGTNGSSNTNATDTNATGANTSSGETAPPCSSGNFSEPRAVWDGAQGPDWGPSLSADGLVLLFSRVNTTTGLQTLQFAERANRDAPFQAPQSFDGLGGGNNTTASLSPDRLGIVFMSDRNGSRDLWEGERNAPNVSFGNVQALKGINTSADEVRPWISSDGLTIYFESNRNEATGYDIWRATRSAVSEVFEQPTQLLGITTNRSEGSPSLTADQLQLFYVSDSAENPGRRTLFESVRGSIDQEFPPGVAVASLSNYEMNGYASVSTDGREIVFSSPGVEVQTLFRAVRQCD